jgi:hypothetical protein
MCFEILSLWSGIFEAYVRLGKTDTSFLMLNIPLGVCFNFHKKKSVTANSVMSFYFEISATSFGLLWSSSGSSKKMNIETLLFKKEVDFQCSYFLQDSDDGHNRPKLAAQISK